MNPSISGEQSWVWSDSFSSAPGWVMALLGILFVITLAMWIFLPFAIYGAKAILREQNAHLAEIHLVLKNLLLEMKSNASSETEKPTEERADP